MKVHNYQYLSLLLLLGMVLDTADRKDPAVGPQARVEPDPRELKSCLQIAKCLVHSYEATAEMMTWFLEMDEVFSPPQIDKGI